MIFAQKETKEDDLMESLSEYLNIHTRRDYARCVIGLINLFADNPISENESVISLFEEQIKNGTLGTSLKNEITQESWVKWE